MGTQNQIPIKSSGELEILARAGKILAAIVKNISCSLTQGMTTGQINAMAERLMEERHVKPAFKGYRGFPGSVCISINHEVVHGIPGARVIRKGDIVSLDVGIICEDYYSDMAVTVGIGHVAMDLQKLLDVTREALYRGIAQAKLENRLSDISWAIQAYVEANGFSVVREYVGHGIGKLLHEPPEIANFGPPHSGPVLKSGMVLAIEPMVNMGTWQTKIIDNGWTVETMDGKCSAHFEHSVAITEKGPVILTA